jgi:hypothetical protein
VDDEARMVARSPFVRRLSQALQAPSARLELLFFAAAVLGLIVCVGYFQVSLSQPACRLYDDPVYALYSGPVQGRSAGEE